MSKSETWPGEDLPVVEDEVEVEETETEDPQETGDELQLRVAHEHAEGELEVPDDIDLLEGEARDARRGVGVIVSRFNGESFGFLSFSLDHAEAGQAAEHHGDAEITGAWMAPDQFLSAHLRM